MVISVLKYRVGLFLIIMIFMYLGSIFEFHSLNGQWEVGDTYYHLFKFLLCLISYVFFMTNLSTDNNAIYHYFSVIRNNMYVLVANIYLILFGLGTQTYGEMSSKGYFYAGNEISGLYILLVPCFLYFVAVRYSVGSLKYIFFSLIIIISTVLLGTKTGLVASVFLTLYVTQLYIKKNKNKVIFYTILCGLIGGIIVWGINLINNLEMWSRLTWMYEHGGLDSLLFSGRDGFWEEEKHDILSRGIWVYLFGLGGDRTVEMDLLDTFLNYGIIGIIMVYGFYCCLLVRSYKMSKQLRIGKIVFVTNIVFLCMSSFAGHMIYSAMASPFTALINTLPLVIKQSICRTNCHESRIY